MPDRPLKVEKFRNQSAKPTGASSHSAKSQKMRGSGPNSAASIIASVASTSGVSFSYSASSHTKPNASPASPGRAGRIDRDITGIPSHRHLRLDVRVRRVVFELEILEAEGEQVLHRRIELHHRQLARRARQLQMRLLQMVEIKMRIAEGVDELAGFETRHLRDHHGEQRVGCDVERH